MRRILSLLLLTSIPLFAGVTVLEQSPGMIRVRLTADTIRPAITGDSLKIGSLCDVPASNRNGIEIPAFKLSLFTDHPEKATIAISVKKRVTTTTRKPLRRSEPNSTTINGLQSKIAQDSYRFAPVSYWLVTPILSTDNGMIEQFTEAEAIIRYVPTATHSRPTSDFEKAIASTTLNPSEFYRVPSTRARATSSNELWLGQNENALMFTVAGKAGTEREADGSIDKLIKLTPSMVTSLGSSIAINEIAVYASNAMVHDSVTPSADNIPSSLVKIPLVLRDKNRDGLFNGSDEILFFAMGTNFWYRKSGNSTWTQKFDDFSEKRNFYITRTSGVTAQKAQLTTKSGTPVTAGLQLIQMRQCNSLANKFAHSGLSSRKWVWSSLTSDNPTFSSSEKLPIFDQATGTSATLTLNFPYGNSFSKDNATLSFNNGDTSFALSGASATYLIPTGAEDFTLQTQGLKPRVNYVDIQGYTIRYFRNLSMKSSSLLRFYGSDRSGFDTIGTYTISNIPSEFTTLFRIDPYTQSVELIDTITTGGTYSWNDKKGTGYQYVAASLSASETPTLSLVTSKTTTQNSTFQVRNLHETSNTSDYMIITPPEFLADAIKLAKHKLSTGRFNHPTVVTTEDIYREFSGGTAQPSAIRNFMVHAVNNWQNGTSLSYLILLGNGHYDYKGVLPGAVANYIPPYIGKDSENSAIEDYFAYTAAGAVAGGNASPQLAVGRVPAKSSTEITGFLNKLIAMEGPTGDFSEWRNEHLLIADDDYQNDTPETIDHWVSSDAVATVIQTNSPTTNIKKLTLFEYPRSGYEKPAARDALNNYINSGIGAMNYFGHGSNDLMADEKIFSVDAITSLNNFKRYLIFSAFSCSVGFFDMPGNPCIAGNLVTEPNRGAVASIASVRVSYASTNTAMAKSFFANYYSPLKSYTIGTAYVAAKATNNLKGYAIFGDPSYRPLAKNSSVGITVTTQSGTAIDTIRGAQTIIVKAKLPANSGIDSVRIHIQNPEQKDVQRKDGMIRPDGKIWKYSLPGSIIVNRAAAISGDSVSVIIKIPPNGTVPVDSMIIRLYGWNDSLPQTCTGLTHLTYNGIDPKGLDTTDKVGPSIAGRVFQDTALADTALPGSVAKYLEINGFQKDSNSVETKPAIVELYFSDSSSIDVSGELPGEGISVSIPGLRPGTNHNGDFRPINDDPNKGRVLLYFNESEFPQAGQYKMIVTAGDYLKNRSQKEFVLDVKSLKNKIYEIGDFYAYPSPAYLGESTRFYFNTPENGVSKMTLKIFTLSGQLIRQFNNVRPGVLWDLTDHAGNRLSPNVYLYRLYVERTSRPTTESLGSGGTSEQIRSEIRKMVIYPPR